MGGQRSTKVVRVCEHCGERYRPWKANKPSRFCSHECARKSGSTGRRPYLKSKPCEQCGAIFSPPNSRQRYCSRICYRDAGGRTILPEGYALVWRSDHPNARPNGQILEHRYVLSEHLERPLEPGETVHHINGDRLDNRIENLQLRSGRHGKGKVSECADCGSRNIQSVEL